MHHNYLADKGHTQPEEWRVSKLRPSFPKLVFSWQRFIGPESGQNMVEYGLVVALVAFGCAATMTSFAQGIGNEFTSVVAVISNAMA